MQEYPTIAFYCCCGKRLYKLSTNVLAYWDDIKCPKCGRKYVSRNSLIAVAVPVSSREKSARVHSNHKAVAYGGKGLEPNRASF